MNKIILNNNLFDDVQFDEELERKKFVEHLDKLKSMDVREQTLYQKWRELKEYNWSHNKASILKANIWQPTNIFDKDKTLAELSAIRPKLRFIEKTDKKGIEDWTLYRIFISSFNFDQNPGRFLRFILEDEITGKILGISSIGSDVVNIGCRDKWIGWTEEQRLNGMLNHTAIGTTIVPTQPFGFNFLGGKLLASMLVTDIIKDVWKREYGETLVGLTTTSLYGDGSMYNSIPWWKSLGESSGKISIKPDAELYQPWHKIVKEKYPEQYQKLLFNDNGGPGTGVKQKIINMIFKEVGIKQHRYIHGFKRGVYFAPFYQNIKEFLTEQITEDKLVPISRGCSEKDVVDWWQKKAMNRYEKLLESNSIKSEKLFYTDIMFMSWDETKNKYLEEVGR